MSDSMYYMIMLTMFIMVIIPMCFTPFFPVYYLLYMLFYVIITLIYYCMLNSLLLIYYVFLVVAGGIMVTFLFFMTFNSTLVIMFLDKLNYFLLFVISMIVYLYIYVNMMTMSESFNEDFFMFIDNDTSYNSLYNCYLNNLGMLMTFICMTYLLFVMYLIIKISTFLKSSPMRSLYE